MSIIMVLIIIAAVGFICWLVETYIPMNPTIKRIFMFVAIFALFLWILQVFGVLGSVTSLRVR
jgi:preprotein translocase subunit SecE